MTSRRADTPVQGPPSHQAPAPAPPAPAGTLGQAGTGGAQHQQGTGGGHHVPSSTRRRARGHTASTDIRVHTPLAPAHAHMCPYTLPAADRNQPCSQSPAPLPHKCTHAPACSRGHTHPCRRHQQASAQPHIPCARGHESLTQAHTLHTFPCGHNQGRGPAGLPRSAVPMAAAGVRPERCVPRRRAWQTLRQRPHIKHTLTHARLSATIHRTRCVYIHTYTPRIYLISPDTHT